MRTRLLALWLFLATMGSLAIGPAEAVVSTTAPRNDYVGTGSVATYSYTFKIFAATDLRVTTRNTSGVETTLTYPTDYTVTGAGSSSGGTITLTAGNLTSGYALTIRFDRTPRQSTDLRNQGSFFPETHEDKFDELTRYSQQLEDVTDRSLHVPETEAGTSAATTLPAATARADKFLAWDSSGNVIAAAGTSGTLGPVSSYINTLLDDVNAATARATLGLSETVSTGTIFDAKGDLITATAADTPAKLTAGSNGQFLMADSAQSAGLRWVDPAIGNPIINGNMEIWQRGTTLANINTGSGGKYLADRFLVAVGNAAAVVTYNRSTSVPTVAQAGVLFNYSLEVDVTTADAAVDATDYAVVQHTIEGYNWRHFAQRNVTLSFWAYSSKTGTHCVTLHSSSADRVYIAEYTINSANTWEYKTITVPASPSSGTWDYTTGQGLVISWVLMVGSTYQNTAGSWINAGALYYGSANQVNVMDNAANFFRITGVKLELGSVATPIQFRSFQDELNLCKRYYQKSFRYTTAPAQNAGISSGAAEMSSWGTGTLTHEFPVYFSPALRVQGTMTTYNPGAANAEVRNITDTADDSSTVSGTTWSETFGTITFTPNAANNAGDVHRVHWTVTAEF